MTRWAVLATVLAAAALLPGCLFDLPDREVKGFEGSLRLGLTLRNGDARPIALEEGEHCPDVELEGDAVRLPRGSRDQERDPLLVVPRPSLEGNWTLGDMGESPSPQALDFPAEVRAPFVDGPVLLATVDWDGEAETAMVDGTPVQLPHSWTKQGSGGWAAELALDLGPQRLVLYSPGACA